MQFKQKINRRQFITSLSIGSIGLTFLLNGCGKEDSNDNGQIINNNGSGNNSNSLDKWSISSNHGHNATLTDGNLKSNIDITVEIKGTSNHSHTITLTVEQLTKIINGNKVTVGSSREDNHTHNVTFN